MTEWKWDKVERNESKVEFDFDYNCNQKNFYFKKNEFSISVKLLNT